MEDIMLPEAWWRRITAHRARVAARQHAQTMLQRTLPDRSMHLLDYRAWAMQPSNVVYPEALPATRRTTFMAGWDRGVLDVTELLLAQMDDPNDQITTAMLPALDDALHYLAAAAYIGCADPRIPATARDLRRDILDLHDGEWSPITNTGGAAYHAEAMLQQLQTLRTAYGIDWAILTVHQRCKFGTDAELITRLWQLDDLLKRNKFQTLQFRVNLDGSITQLVRENGSRDY